MIPEQMLKNFKKEIKGEVYDDDLTRGIYSTDASIYKIMPKLVVVPKDEDDVLTTIKFASEHKISLLPRGGGTSLAGQTVGDSIVLDFSKYMTNILEFNEKEKWVRVQPGLVHSELNKFLEPYGLIYAPDEATINRANVGGVVANNSSGSRSLVFGKAIDHILEVKIALASGKVINLGEITKEEAQKKAEQEDEEGNIYKTLIEILEKDEKEIIARYPKVMRRVTGYSLDEFVEGKQWNMAKLISGSEGTLATILDLKLNLINLPKKRSITVVHFKDRLEAISTVGKILEHKPSAVELLDDNVINIALTNPATKQISGFIQGHPGAILIVEFFGENYDELLEKHKKLETDLMKSGRGYAYPYYQMDDPEFDNVWEVRKQGLGLLLSVKTEAKPIPFIEDLCIPIKHLPEYVDRVLEFCHNLDTKVSLYAHASVGVLHIRPILNLRLQEDIDKMRKISEFALDRVIEYKGSWSGEHGDGLSRSYGIPKFYGDVIYNDFKKLKTAFDPHGLMNPGKIVDPYPMDTNLRYGADYKEIEVSTLYHYRKEEGFSTLINMCNGVGVCHRVSGGVMCPTYKATLDEKHSTRGRANALRMTISGELGEGDLTNEELAEALDLCVSCKSCKTECPSNVDVAKLKSEVLQKKYDKKGYGIREFFIIYSDLMSKYLSGALSGIVNAVIKTKIFRKTLEKVAKIDARRILPYYAKYSLVRWYNKEYRTNNDKEVVLFADIYTNYHEPEIGKAAIGFLDKLGYKVILVNTGGSKRPLISNGFLRKAKQYSSKIIEKLQPYMDREIPVIVIEPGSYSALADDIPDLMDDEFMAKILKNSVVSIERFVSDLVTSGKVKNKFKSTLKHHVIHGHCHQKAIEGMEPIENIFKFVEGTFEILDVGCCGMAGAFGFEKEHYDLSKKIYDIELDPVVSKLTTGSTILATGFSCRHQLRDFSDKEIKHWIEVLS
ncbi:MAG TPA: FAD-binding oxidoreductase [Bacteroidetes bacterium]|nr:FAD-binding oxidoreductase [Bacteroidota bacterium]